MLGEFKGEYTHSVDGKGRVAIPARFRAKLDGGAVLTRGIEPCLLNLHRRDVGAEVRGPRSLGPHAGAAPPRRAADVLAGAGRRA